MDIKQSLDFRHYRYTRANNLGYNRFDYAHEGILYRVLPKILFKSNPILVSFLQLIDMELIMLFKSIDNVKKFKYISLY